MIVDCHTHIWADISQLGSDAAAMLRRQSGSENIAAGATDHSTSAACVDKTLVMAFRSEHLGANVPNELIAEYVAQNSNSMIGIACVDPTQDSSADDAEAALSQQEFRGLTVSPSAQNFHPADSRVTKIYELAEQKHVPLFLQQGTHFHQSGTMEYARPALLDEIAREHPELTIIISAFGHPWIEECIALIGKHPRVFTDIAGLIRRPWQAYNALVLAHQFNVMDKVFFGSDFPYLTAAEAIKTVYRLHEVTQGTNLPAVPREALRSMVERNTLAVLGIARPGEEPPPLPDDEEYI